MIFTICKQCLNQKLSYANQNHPCVNFFHPYANPKISAIPKSFAKSWTITAYFDGVITCPTFLVQSVEVTFSGQKKITRFTLVYTSLHPFAPRCHRHGIRMMKGIMVPLNQRKQPPLKDVRHRTSDIRYRILTCDIVRAYDHVVYNMNLQNRMSCTYDVVCPFLTYDIV